MANTKNDSFVVNASPCGRTSYLTGGGHGLIGGTTDSILPSKDKEGPTTGKRYVATNVAPDYTQRREVKQRIKQAEEKVFDENRKVKFNELRNNDLNDLFKNTPAFDEPIPKYQWLQGFVDERLEHGTRLDEASIKRLS